MQGNYPEETIRHSEHGENFEIKNGTAGQVTDEYATGRMASSHSDLTTAGHHTRM
jgi:hypothetical protein